MPATKTKPTKTRIPFERLTDEEFHSEMQQAWADFDNLSETKKKALFIKWDILNPDGTLRRYPMDHVPLGPRE